jgi:hypothetical protein
MPDAKGFNNSKNISIKGSCIRYEMTKTSRKTSRKPHAKTTKDPRFNVSP